MHGCAAMNLHIMPRNSIETDSTHETFRLVDTIGTMHMFVWRLFETWVHYSAVHCYGTLAHGSHRSLLNKQYFCCIYVVILP